MTTEFNERLAAINRAELRRFLQGLREPCYESQLLRIAFPTFEISHAEPLALYQHHFLLFHALYQLQEEFYREGQYLFIHFMRTMLLPYPATGQCQYFHEQLAAFCRAACPDGKAYCAYHADLLGDAALDELSMKYFYADAGNFSKLDEETATAFLNGTWEILHHYDAYQESFRVLELPETFDLDLIKKTFKRLAKAYHPDRGQTSHDKFVEINNAYQFLLRVIPAIKSRTA